MSGPENSRRDQAGRFLPGVSGNPAGKPKGARHELAQRFVTDLHNDWVLHGPDAIKAMRAEKPAEYVKVVAGLLPKEVKLETNAIADMSDDELGRLIDIIRAAVEPSGEADGGAGSKDRGKPSGGVSPIH